MINFSSNFWMQFGMLMKDNVFDKHFENQELQLTTLLDDDLIIGEFRNQNSKLMDYIQTAQMSELVKYITEMPVDDSNSKRAFRYPFYSCELLCCEIPKVADHFFGEDKSLLHQLLAFLNQEQEVNSVLAGYVCKVLFNLSKLRYEQFLEECFAYPQLITRLIRQLQSRSVTELIIKLLAIESEIQKDFIAERTELLLGVLQKVKDDSNFEVPTNVSYIIQELTSKAYLIQNFQPLLDVLFEQQTEFFCQQVVNPTAFVSLSAGTILYNLLILLYKNNLRAQDENVVLKIEQDHIFEKIENNLQSWLDYLQEDSQSHIFGQHKLKIIEIIGVSVTLNKDSFILKLSDLDVFRIYNSLFIKYEKHDILHLSYYRFIVHIVEQKQEALMENLFNKNNLVQFLLECTRDVKNEKNQRKGYLGFVTKLAHSLEEQASKNDYLKKVTESNEWVQFKQQYFEKANKLNNHELGGNTRQENSEEIECHFSKQEIQDKFSEFLKPEVFQQSNEENQGNDVFSPQFVNNSNNNENTPPENENQQNIFNNFGFQAFPESQQDKPENTNNPFDNFGIQTFENNQNENNPFDNFSQNQDQQVAGNQEQQQNADHSAPDNENQTEVKAEEKTEAQVDSQSKSDSNPVQEKSHQQENKDHHHQHNQVEEILKQEEEEEFQINSFWKMHPNDHLHNEALYEFEKNE